ncbi:hypothetical protein [Streptomyces narbonensis]|uniref:hypothetical protein n=1 Tax=Streptomyces narbonensis TaxID=67333 RepID=UPI00167572C9|nr:hypothetical protein [Streptomyces narbonensis]
MRYREDGRWRGAGPVAPPVPGPPAGPEVELEVELDGRDWCAGVHHEQRVAEALVDWPTPPPRRSGRFSVASATPTTASTA